MPALTLSLLNHDRLPDGGPVQFTARGQRGLEIGRDQYLDWVLPDPARVVSSRHCEVQYREQGYWLHDVSTNGTFVNGAEARMAVPHRLRHGDRFEIGPYIIGVMIEGEEREVPPAAAPVAPGFGEDIWSARSTAPPIPAHELRPPPPAASRSDLMDWFVDIPDAQAAPVRAAPAWEAPAPFAAAMPQPTRPGPAPAPAPASGFPSLPRADWTAPSVLEFDSSAHPELSPAPRETSLPPATPRRPEPIEQPARDGAALPFRDAAPPPQPPRAAPEPPSRPERAPAPAAAFDLAGLLARGAGVPPDVFSRRSPEELALLTGALLRINAENLKQLLMVRAETKGLVRSTNQTMIQAFENNPLKFSPSVEDALRTMFGPSTQSYLDARRAFEESFRDLKSHQMNTYVAMQQALKILIEDLDPEAIDKSTEKEGGLGGMIGSRKGRLWDLYMTRWKAKTARHDNGLVDAFMLYFSECYDRLSSKSRT